MMPRSSIGPAGPAAVPEAEAFAGRKGEDGARSALAPGCAMARTIAARTGVKKRALGVSPMIFVRVQ